MQVKLITTVETIIDIDPENSTSYEEAKAEILGHLSGTDEDEAFTEDTKNAHHDAVQFDHVRTQSVTHSFEEVK